MRLREPGLFSANSLFAGGWLDTRVTLTLFSPSIARSEAGGLALELAKPRQTGSMPNRSRGAAMKLLRRNGRMVVEHG
jgi:hypothetical protein